MKHRKTFGYINTLCIRSPVLGITLQQNLILLLFPLKVSVVCESEALILHQLQYRKPRKIIKARLATQMELSISFVTVMTQQKLIQCFRMLQRLGLLGSSPAGLGRGSGTGWCPRGQDTTATLSSVQSSGKHPYQDPNSRTRAELSNCLHAEHFLTEWGV